MTLHGEAHERICHPTLQSLPTRGRRSRTELKNQNI